MPCADLFNDGWLMAYHWVAIHIQTYVENIIQVGVYIVKPCVRGTPCAKQVSAASRAEASVSPSSREKVSGGLILITLLNGPSVDT